MALIKDGKLAADPFLDVSGADEIPTEGALLVSLEQWQDHWDALLRRGFPVGVRLRSDQHPEVIADDLDQLALVALEFPAFKDGRAYSYARLLRQRFGFWGELRAVGDVLLEQLHFMHRVGFDAFELNSEDPEADFRTAMTDFSVCYQPAADGFPTAVQLRHPTEPG
jgi:uncharacterized protein (DUF934 family)